jgi:hypothetical protein
MGGRHGDIQSRKGLEQGKWEPVQTLQVSSELSDQDGKLRTTESKMEYKILRETKQDLLENEVNKAIGEGWRPQAGVRTEFGRRTPGYNENWFQAMVREKSQKSPK